MHKRVANRSKSKLGGASFLRRCMYEFETLLSDAVQAFLHCAFRAFLYGKDVGKRTTVNTLYSEVLNLHYMVNLDEKWSKIFTIW